MPSPVTPEAVLAGRFLSRAATRDDVEEVYAIFGGYWEALAGASVISLDELQNLFSVPGFDPASSTRVVLSPEGQFVGGAMVIDLASPPVHPGVPGGGRGSDWPCYTTPLVNSSAEASSERSWVSTRPA